MKVADKETNTFLPFFYMRKNVLLMLSFFCNIYPSMIPVYGRSNQFMESSPSTTESNNEPDPKKPRLSNENGCYTIENINEQFYDHSNYIVSGRNDYLSLNNALYSVIDQYTDSIDYTTIENSACNILETDSLVDDEFDTSALDFLVQDIYDTNTGSRSHGISAATEQNTAAFTSYNMQNAPLTERSECPNDKYETQTHSIYNNCTETQYKNDEPFHDLERYTDTNDFTRNIVEGLNVLETDFMVELAPDTAALGQLVQDVCNANPNIGNQSNRLDKDTNLADSTSFFMENIPSYTAISTQNDRNSFLQIKKDTGNRQQSQEARNHDVSACDTATNEVGIVTKASNAEINITYLDLYTTAKDNRKKSMQNDMDLNACNLDGESESDAIGAEMLTSDNSFDKLKEILNNVKNGISFLSFQKFNDVKNTTDYNQHVQKYATTKKITEETKHIVNIWRSCERYLSANWNDFVITCKIDISLERLIAAIEDAIAQINTQNLPSSYAMRDQCLSASNSETQNQFDNVILMIVNNFNMLSLSVQDIQLLYLAYVTHSCFEYNDKLGLYQFKKSLWGIHAFMSEFYFYIIWKLQRLNDQNALIKDCEYYYKTHLIDEIKYIHGIISTYSKKEKIDEETQAARKFFDAMYSDINTFRDLILTYLEKFNRLESSTLLYYIGCQMINSSIKLPSSLTFAANNPKSFQHSFEDKVSVKGRSNLLVDNRIDKSYYQSLHTDKLVKNTLFLLAFTADFKYESLSAWNIDMVKVHMKNCGLKRSFSAVFFNRIYNSPGYRQHTKIAVVKILIFIDFIKSLGGEKDMLSSFKLYENANALQELCKLPKIKDRLTHQQEVVYYREMVLQALLK